MVIKYLTEEELSDDLHYGCFECHCKALLKEVNDEGSFFLCFEHATKRGFEDRNLQ